MHHRTIEKDGGGQSCTDLPKFTKALQNKMREILAPVLEVQFADLELTT